ncbi:MAG: hypothetical protein K2Z81_07380 [Cyanobacteria bacterium]|nr:hypothetical protein [Cyanobacteriota bacterium]
MPEFPELQSRRLLCLGAGPVASAFDQLFGRHDLYDRKFATTRNPERLARLKSAGFEPMLVADKAWTALEAASEGADVLVSIPPDGESDKRLSACLKKHRSLVYISSTVVYGDYEGDVTDDTTLAWSDERARARLNAEKYWLDIGGSVIRAPGLYGPHSGLHIRLKERTFRIPGDGSNHSSRIHLHDLARMIHATFCLQSQSTFLAGDLLPSTLNEVVTWLCERMKIPYPDSIPVSQAHYTLVSNRRVIVAPSLRRLGVELQFPTYKEGFTHCLESLE